MVIKNWGNLRKKLLTEWSIIDKLNKKMLRISYGEYMKREEKNQQTRRRILDSALAEFSEHGYEASSVNAICAVPNISKGIIYHYFNTKDELYLACIEECFALLTKYLKNTLKLTSENIQDQLEEYFIARLNFFNENYVYQRIFYEAILGSPFHLRKEIKNKKQEFELLNLQILERILEPVSLRPGITKEDVFKIFKQFQYIVNIECQYGDLSGRKFELHEKNCRKFMSILLYGIVKRCD